MQEIWQKKLWLIVMAVVWAVLAAGCEGDAQQAPALPSGPITNSGMDIIDAVINHPDTNYLFFFSDLKGEFHFASTGEEFEALKQKYPWQ